MGNYKGVNMQDLVAIDLNICLWLSSEKEATSPDKIRGVLIETLEEMSNKDLMELTSAPYNPEA